MASDFTLEPRGLVEIKVSYSWRILCCKSNYLSVCWCTYWSGSVFVCWLVYLLIWFWVCQCTFDLALCLSVCRCTYWSLRLSVGRCTYWSASEFVCLSVYLLNWFWDCLFVHVLIDLALSLSVCRCTYWSGSEVACLGCLKPKACVLLLWQGKGQMDTYWLLDRDGFEKSLPCMPDCRKFNDVTVRRISKTQGPTIRWRIHGSRDNFGGIPSLSCFRTRRF